MTRRVLVVDDEPQIRALMQRLIGRVRVDGGVTVDAAEDVPAALALLESGSYDLVLSDFRMPGPDGLELLNTVREKWPRTPRLLMTGYNDEQLPADARDSAELTGFIRKPWNNAAVIELVGECLRATTDAA